MHEYQEIYQSWDQFPKYDAQEYPVKREKKHDYINIVYLNGYQRYERESHAENYIHCIDINSSPDSLINWNFVLGCCGNHRKITIPK